ncbi:conserved hypothetical protein [Leishmania major strain Friedlin]|uniref:Ubiquitin-like domain-containing protein n=1 Tax=Leishmania major TaxID=5664 RepID=Q4Q2M7_LEIMA|nr:conserved hypothetical protein [Leishmania major strain Friedlin]CAG9582194.1 Tir_chaperone_protein_(CesT)_family_-_putative [Leishmania major strain Friedlin]CAJ08038.1 conserved hypothetical protein [Leishmania major strain Friedlin]|eukprot:XP_001686421.1 conserved hypothetical protein [Leishmania major strain Friedlin]
MESATAAAAPTACVYVLSDVDGYKYKLVMQGDLQLLTVRKVKRYLQRAAGIDPAQQLLTFNSVALDDTMSGKEAGFFDGAILRLQQVYSSSAALAQCISADGSSPFHSAHGGPGCASSFTAPPRGAQDPGTRTSPRGNGSFFAEASPRLSAPATRGAVGASQLISSPHALPPLLRCLSPNQLAGGAKREAHDAVSCTRRDVVAGMAYSSPPELAGTTGTTASTPQVIPGRTSSASSADGDGVHVYYRELEERVAALSLDNVRLREQLQAVARQAAEACTDGRHEEELKRLKAAVAVAQESVKDAERAAANRWRVKEEELVKELDLLREERRRFHEESTAQEAKLRELVHSMEGEIRGLKYELHDKDEALQAARLSLAELRSEKRSWTDAVRRGVDICPRGEASHPFAPAASRHARIPLQQRQHGCSANIDELAETAMEYLTQAFESATPLELEPENDTCVVPVADDLNVLVTLDRETERLYLYVTLLNHLPSSPTQRMRLYEMLLEGALLGKDMAGGGVGVSPESNLVLMSVSANLRHSGASALAATAAPFVIAAQAWTKSIDVLLNT